MEKPRETDNIEHTRYMTTTNKSTHTHNEETQRMSNTGPTKKVWMNPCAPEG